MTRFSQRHNSIQVLDLGAIALLLQRRTRRDDHVIASGKLIEGSVTDTTVVPKNPKF